MQIDIKNILVGLGASSIVMMSLFVAVVSFNSGDGITASLTNTVQSGGGSAPKIREFCGFEGIKSQGLRSPGAVTFTSEIDSAGFIKVKSTYIANTGGKDIQILQGNTAKNIAYFIDENGGGLTPFVKPTGILASNDLKGGSEQYLFVVDQGTNKVYQFKPDTIIDPNTGKEAFSWLGDWDVSSPTKIIKLIGHGKFAIVSGKNTVYTIDASDFGNKSTLISGLTNISGITASPKYLFLAESSPENKIHRFDLPSGGNPKIYGKVGPNEGEFGNPVDIAWDENTQQLFVANQPGGGAQDSIYIFTEGLGFKSNYQIDENGTNHTGNILSITFGPDGGLYITTTDGKLKKVGVKCVVLTITKVYKPAGTLKNPILDIFDFNVLGDPTNPAVKDFQLDVNPNTKTIISKKSMNVPLLSTQTITELGVDPDTVMSICQFPYRLVANKGFYSQRTKGPVATVKYQPSDSVIFCTFYNWDKTKIPKPDAELTILKDVVPGESPLDYNFDIYSLGNPSVFENFNLDDDRDPTLPNTKVIPVAGGHGYIIEEFPLADVDVLSSCEISNSINNTVRHVEGLRNVLTVNIEKGDKALCTFKNCAKDAEECKPQKPEITVIKDVIPGESPQDFSYQATSSTTRTFLRNFLLDDDQTPTLPNKTILDNLVTGSYTIIEALVSGFKVISYCSITNTQTGNTRWVFGNNKIDLTLNAGDKANCTFRNCDPDSNSNSCEQEPNPIVDNTPKTVIDELGRGFGGGAE